MSVIDEAIYTRATTGPTLQPLIGTRCYPVQLPQNPAYKAITYQRISTPREHAMGSEPGIAHPRFQLTAFDTTRTGARELAEAIRADFSRWRGTIAIPGGGNVIVQDTFVENTVDLEADVTTGVHMVPVDVIIHHVEN
jgi:hypothetical protein